MGELTTPATVALMVTAIGFLIVGQWGSLVGRVLLYGGAGTTFGLVAIAIVTA